MQLLRVSERSALAAGLAPGAAADAGVGVADERREALLRRLRSDGSTSYSSGYSLPSVTSESGKGDEASTKAAAEARMSSVARKEAASFWSYYKKGGVPSVDTFPRVLGAEDDASKPLNKHDTSMPPQSPPPIEHLSPADVELIDMEEWLKSLKLFEYRDALVHDGFDSLGAIACIEEHDLDKVRTGDETESSALNCSFVLLSSFLPSLLPSSVLSCFECRWV